MLDWRICKALSKSTTQATRRKGVGMSISMQHDQHLLSVADRQLTYGLIHDYMQLP